MCGLDRHEKIIFLIRRFSKKEAIINTFELNFMDSILYPCQDFSTRKLKYENYDCYSEIFKKMKRIKF